MKDELHEVELVKTTSSLDMKLGAKRSLSAKVLFLRRQVSARIHGYSFKYSNFGSEFLSTTKKQPSSKTSIKGDVGVQYEYFRKLTGTMINDEIS